MTLYVYLASNTVAKNCAPYIKGGSFMAAAGSTFPCQKCSVMTVI